MRTCRGTLINFKLRRKIVKVCQSQGINMFVEYISIARLMDAPSKGLSCKWINRKEGDECVWERLDRFFVNMEGMELLNSLVVIVLPMLASNYARHLQEGLSVLRPCI